MLLLARTTPVDEVEKKTQGLSVFLVDIREARRNGMDIRPLKAMINHNTTEIFFDDVPHPGRQPDRRGGQRASGTSSTA